MPPRPQHRWSEEDREIIRRDYRHTRRSCEVLGARFGVSWFALRYQVGVMGIARSGNRRPWSEEEDERLCQLMELYPTSKVARRMHRTINSVVGRSKRLGVSSRNRSGWYTKGDVCRILGVDHRWVQRRIDSGALPATWHNGRRPRNRGAAMWHIAQEDLRRFIRQYPEELNGRNVDLVQIVEILVGLEGVKRRNNDERMMHE